MAILHGLPSRGFPVDKQFHFGQVSVYLHHLDSVSLPRPYVPVAAGDMQYRDVFPPHGLEVVCHVFRCAVVIEQAFVVDSRHRLLPPRYVKVNEVPVSASTDPFFFLDEGQIMLHVCLVILYAEVKGFRVGGM